MPNEKLTSHYYAGWDVGGWNCDKNSKSRDAIVILDNDLKIHGKPWRGNLRESINTANSSTEWVSSLFELCGVSRPGQSNIVLAIDTPLGFAEAFRALVTQGRYAQSVEDSESNPYLYRQTERFLFQHGIKPLSPIKDMIGSQATKGIHVLAKFASVVSGCGVWNDGKSLTAIEAYPSPCKHSDTIQTLRASFESLGHDDKDDALTCALLAYLFSQHPDTLTRPDDSVPEREGWIWLPNEAFEI